MHATVTLRGMSRVLVDGEWMPLAPLASPAHESGDPAVVVPLVAIIDANDRVCMPQYDSVESAQSLGGVGEELFRGE